MIALIALLGCQVEPDDTALDAPAAAPMASDRVLVRASLDLRGIRPTPAELGRVEADPAALDAVIDEYLQDPRFGPRVRDIYAQYLLTRSDGYLIGADQYGIDDTPGFQTSVGDETLRIFSTVAEEDLPYTEIVTGDWTVANETLATAWPIAYPEGSSGWIRTTYTDGRPTAGILSTNSLWWRYPSSGSNANRGRANAISRILLCHDYLTRPIGFDRNVNILDQAAVDDALHNNEACVNCHSSLDPIAAYLYGFWWDGYTSTDSSAYHPEREREYRSYNGVEPAWYGEPGYRLSDLGRQIAKDPRYPQCAVEQAWTTFVGRAPTRDDEGAMLKHREAFLQGGLTVRSLWRSVLRDPRYRAPLVTEDPLDSSLKMVTTDQLASQVEDVTGFHWTYAGYDMLGTDSVGVRMLAGGADGYSVTKVASSPNTTIVLVQQRLAEAAADHVVVAESGLMPAARGLFTEVDFSETPETNRAAMVAQIQRLHLRVFGHRVAADSEEVSANLALWSDIYSFDNNPVNAWRGVLIALLRDPDFLFY